MHRYLAGALTARTGDETAGPALLLAAFAVTGSAARASTLLAAATVAAAVGGPCLGTFLDRSRRPGHLLAAALFLHALGLTAVLLTLGRAPFAVTLALAVLTGLPGPALSAGWTARLPVPPTPAGRTRATALDAMTFHAASLAGPALAGLTARALGASEAVAAAAALVCVGAAVALWLPDQETASRISGRAGGGRFGDGRSGEGRFGEGRSEEGWSGEGRSDEGRSGGGGSGEGGSGGGGSGEARFGEGRSDEARSGEGGSGEARSDEARFGEGRSGEARSGQARQADAPALARLATGTRYVLTHPPLAAATLGSVVSCAAQGMLAACVPLLGERALGGAADGALLLSCTAASALAADVVLARRAPGPDPGRVLRGGALIQAGALVLAATGHPAAVVLSAVLAGVGEGPQLTALFAIRHRETPPELRAQIFATGASAKVTGFALGAAAAGLLAARSLPTALLAAAALQLLAARVTGGRVRGSRG
ncbi:hypothetical protein JCM4814A_47380 [Streptomyces phaeofaciens JCM 4814]|uniref:Integral membrane protein n=2 Tax=Streptomyces phaeofaciens TaxID=68254 RepID=A0A918H1X9_9ACTN|nr:hypothetical protein GCM10010226_04040 [Streptomyces phaeofaciens]